jgi:diaminohydroxyphosphoribosylaminopyrimidine deaminase / 5-amino-6-(5-phosphoribosylamino)uracil reductase
MLEHDLSYMLEAIQLAKKGWYNTMPNPRVGCVLVKDNRIIGRGWHHQAGLEHAEINALIDANSQKNKQVEGATAYVTLEPCSHFGKTPPCSDALIKAKVKRVVIAMLDPNPLVAGQGAQRLKDAGIEVFSGVLEKEALALNRGFIKRMKNNKPFVRCKMAASLDGQTALQSGESKWITSPQARQDVQRLRAESCAILTGIGTVLADDPSMTVRDSSFQLIQQPSRIIVDSQLKISPSANILQQSGQVHIFTANNITQTNKFKRLQQTGAVLHTVGQNIQGLDLNQILSKLAELQFNEVLLESGKTLAGSMLSAGLVDELVIYLAPKLMGSSSRGMFDLAGINTMSDVMGLQIKDVRSIGQDIRLITKPSINKVL